MHQIKQVVRIDFYLEVFFADGSVRAINLLPYLRIDPLSALNGPVNTKKLAFPPDGRSIVWDDGSEISADYLYDNSLLIGRWEGHVQAWRRSVRFSNAVVKVEIQNNEVCCFLLLDGMPYPALLVSSAWFGIYENTAWYDVPFPGDGEDSEADVSQWEEPQIVFDTLKELVELVNRILERGTETTVDITELLVKTGRALYVGSINPRAASLLAGRFKKRTPA